MHKRRVNTISALRGHGLARQRHVPLAKCKTVIFPLTIPEVVAAVSGI